MPLGALAMRACVQAYLAAWRATLKSNWHRRRRQLREALAGNTGSGPQEGRSPSSVMTLQERLVAQGSTLAQIEAAMRNWSNSAVHAPMGPLHGTRRDLLQMSGSNTWSGPLHSNGAEDWPDGRRLGYEYGVLGEANVRRYRDYVGGSGTHVASITAGINLDVSTNYFNNWFKTAMRLKTAVGISKWKCHDKCMPTRAAQIHNPLHAYAITCT